ncbi:hypothetical protein SY83_10220 [Paenibacillus swuensis]|uniref:Glycoside hydrolase family 5 domain-containing protein n=1 Tax=Paenibacillus swuensis TaxID=1178515 RepID=A0A172THZ6_9BACL|nr:glycoside hydrolase family 5 protein [Paenibacillus swuensis]ANE46586.1 hypothetical protein SY83_10220 [Paenibacillus swuensis]
MRKRSSWKGVAVYVLLLALMFGTVNFASVTTTEAAGDSYTVSGTKIMKNGTEFILNGTNVNGPQWCWGSNTVNDANLIVNKWKFNSIRVNTHILAKGCDFQPTLQQIVDTYTPLGAVVMIEAHEDARIGNYYTSTTSPTLTELKNYWINLANQFKNNSNVWFNIANEPGDWNLDAQWKTMHKTVIEAIRGTGATNIIVVDGGTFGQDCGYSQAGNVVDGDSAVISWGQEVKSYDTTGNTIFSVHNYGCWDWSESKLTDYVNRVHAKNLALVFGEWGAQTGGEHQTAAQNTVNVSQAKKVGKMVWHWDGGDAFDLTNTGGGWGGDINRTDGTKPTNLTWLGSKVWDANRYTGSVAAKLSGTLYGTTPAFNGTDTFHKAMDGNTGTFFDYANSDGGYVGLDLGASVTKQITKVRLYPRSGMAYRMDGGKIQGSNTSSTSGFTDLGTVSSAQNAVWHEVTVTNTTKYRYVRYLSPSGSHCNVAELEFWGK